MGWVKDTLKKLVEPSESTLKQGLDEVVRSFVGTPQQGRFIKAESERRVLDLGLGTDTALRSLSLQYAEIHHRREEMLRRGYEYVPAPDISGFDYFLDRYERISGKRKY